jgi:hypothetical protein
MGEGKTKYSKLISIDILQTVSAFKSTVYVMFVGCSRIPSSNPKQANLFVYVCVCVFGGVMIKILKFEFNIVERAGVQNFCSFFTLD